MKLPDWINGNGSGSGNGNGNGGKGDGGFEIPGITLEDDLNVGPSDGNNKKYHRPAAHYDSRYWDAGWTDGRVGQPKSAHEQLLVSWAEVERHQEIRKARADRARAQAEAAALKNWLDLIRTKLDGLRAYYTQLSGRRQQYHTEASLPLGAMYLLFGTLLFLADVPLSLRLVAEGLRIPAQYRIHGTTRVVLVSEIFSDPLLVLKYLWEAVLLALGIALLGIIVKFFVDAVIFRDEDEPPLTKKAAVGMSLAFALFVICTWCLGRFRAAVYEAEWQKSHPGVKPVDFENWAFLLLTLTLPIAGGFCLSAGARKLERAKPYYFTSARIWWLERKEKRVFKRYSEKTEAVRLLEEMLGAAGDSLALSRASLRKNLYEHGYLRGRSVPETRDADETLYGFCKTTLNRVLASKAVRRLQDIRE